MAKCKDCGYLAVRDFKSKEPREADPVVRTIGKHASILGGEYVAQVFCWKSLRDFGEDETGSQSSVQSAMDREIECDAATPYRQGRTPWKVEDDQRLESVEARQRQLAEGAKAEKLAQQGRDQKRDTDNWKRFWIGISLTISLAVCNWLYSWATRATPGTTSKPNASAPAEQ